MSLLTGREALSIVNKTRPGLAFVFLSGVKKHLGKGAEPMVGGSAHLKKGQPQELHAVVRQVLSGGALEGGSLNIQDGSVLRGSVAAPRPRILIVDDQEENLVALEAALDGDLGADFVRARSGQEALGKLLEGGYAVIVRDGGMPGMTGLETAEVFRKRARTRWIPVIFLTAALDNPAEIVQGYASGCVDYIAKPFVAKILRAKVEVFLELWKKTITLERQAADLRATNEGLEAFTGGRRSEEHTA